MKIIVGGRQQGKTTALLRKLDNNPSAVLISATVSASYWARRQALKMGLNVSQDQFLYASQASEVLKRRRDLSGAPLNPKIYVDQLEDCFAVMWGRPDVTATASADRFEVARLPEGRGA